MSEKKYTIEELTQLAQPALSNLSKALTEVRTIVDDLCKQAAAEKARRKTAVRKLNETANILRTYGYITDYHFAGWTHQSLKRCPACDGEAYVQKYQYGEGWIVICGNCCHRSVEEHSPADAIRAWNNGEYTDESIMTMTKIDGSPRSRRKGGKVDEDDT